MKVRLMNKISQEGLKRLPADRYEVGEDLDHADAIMVRSRHPCPALPRVPAPV